MYRQFLKALAPVKNKFARAAGSGGETKDVSEFQRNSISKEQKLSETLRRSLPGITYISVEDISGGCGAMFEISVEAKEFAGLSTVKQHRLVTESLKSEIAEMHGIRIHTTATKTDK